MWPADSVDSTNFIHIFATKCAGQVTVTLVDVDGWGVCPQSMNRILEQLGSIFGGFSAHPCWSEFFHSESCTERLRQEFTSLDSVLERCATLNHNLIEWIAFPASVGGLPWPAFALPSPSASAVAAALATNLGRRSQFFCSRRELGARSVPNVRGHGFSCNPIRYAPRWSGRLCANGGDGAV